MDNGSGGELIGGAIGLFSSVVGLAFGIIMIIGMWKLFEKAGKPGWAAIIPFYNWWVLFEIVGLKGWYILGLFIPIVNLVTLVMMFVAIFKLPAVFGKDTMWGCLSLLFFPIVVLVLGFSDAQYQGSGA